MFSLKYYKFKKDYYPIIIEDELVVLDICSNNFFFFDKNESLEILNITSSVHPFIPDHLSFFFEKSKLSLEIIAFDEINGIDNYSWSDVKFFRKDTNLKISIYDKSLIIFLYFAFQINKNSFFKYKINLLNFIKRFLEKPSSININYANSAANYIHDISKYLPFRLKCLEFSFILTAFLYLKRINCTMHIGVQKYDFLSHAWVSIESDIISDSPHLSDNLAIILSI